MSVQAAQKSGGSSGLMRAGAALAIAQTVANGGNYLLNLALGRWLSPAEFADASLMVTLMLLASAIALGLQLVTARQIALADGSSASSGSRGPSAATLGRPAMICGLILGAALALGAPLWQDLLNTGSPWPFVMLGLGMPAYLAQAVGRGVLQGHLRFGALAGSYVVEMVVRLGLSLALVGAGLGVSGATAGLAVSFVATWVAVRYATGTIHADGPTSVADRAYIRQVGILLAGQIVANNADVLVAKHFLPGDVAARYAAVALVGRAVFFLSWSVAITMFPVAAKHESGGLQSRRLLARGAGAVFAIGLVCTVAADLIGGRILAVVLGSEYDHLARPLAGYAFATTLLAVANLVASHHLAAGRSRESWLLLAGAAGQTGALLIWHSTISAMVLVQIVCMSALCLATFVAGQSTFPVVRSRGNRLSGAGSR
jgi:O-antigen/teichoic acid export membrane protein